MPAAYTATAEAVRKLGREILPAVPGSAALYAARHETEPYAGVDVRRDERYGEHERHRLDVFTPQQRPGALPAFVFVHGGGFVGGDKRTPGSPYLDNIALWAARHGMVGVNITYRLAPEFTFPSGSQDLAAAVRWVREHAGEIGADPARIFVMGTSAGAVHVANFIAHAQFAGDRQGVAGAIMLSGAYDLESLAADGMARSYFGEDASRYPAMSPLSGLLASPIPLMFVLTEHDPPMFEQQALRLVQAWFERHGRWPELVRLMAHNHLTSTFHLNTDDEVLGDQMLDFIARQDQPASSSAAAMAG
jgi:triacylglycerol lipase